MLSLNVSLSSKLTFLPSPHFNTPSLGSCAHKSNRDLRNIQCALASLYPPITLQYVHLNILCVKLSRLLPPLTPPLVIHDQLVHHRSRLVYLHVPPRHPSYSPLPLLLRHLV